MVALGVKSPVLNSDCPQSVMIFAWIIDLFDVIARECGRSSNHKILRDYWMPRFRGA